MPVFDIEFGYVQQRYFAITLNNLQEDDDHEGDSEEQGDLEDLEIEHIEKEITDEDILSIEQDMKFSSPQSHERGTTIKKDIIFF